MIPFVTIILDKPYRLRFGMGAMIEFENITGVKLTALDTEQIDPAILAKVLWLMLKQEDKEMTLEKACQLVDEYSESLEDVMLKVTDAIKAAFPETPKNAKPPRE